MSNFTLDGIREVADKKYAATNIRVDDETTVVLLNPLRLEKAKRDELMNLQSKLEDSGKDENDGENVDQVEIFRDCFRTVATNTDACNKMLDQVGDDLAVLSELFSVYGDGLQVGEASASAS